MSNNTAYLSKSRKNKTFLKDKVCKIVKKTVTQDDYGAPISTWQYLTNSSLWCYARQLSQDQVWQGMQFDTNETRFFVLNYRDDVALNDLVEYAGSYYQITRLDTEDDYHGDLYVYAKDAAAPTEIEPAATDTPTDTDSDADTDADADTDTDTDTPTDTDTE